MQSFISSITLPSPPWEALILQLAEPTPDFWLEHAFRFPKTSVDNGLVQLVLANGVEMRAASKRSAAAFQRWQLSSLSSKVDIVAVRALARVLSEVGGAEIKLRRADQGITVAYYVAPKAATFPKLLYAANNAISVHPPLLQSLLSGLILFAIHPMADGNGRAARMYWVKGLHAAGHSSVEIAKALAEFYGASRIASLIAINCANSGGTSLPFVKRWHQILTALRPDAI